MPAPNSISEFLELGQKAGLFDDQVSSIYKQRFAQDSNESLKLCVDDLLQTGVLTRFQVNQLLAGKWRGFVLAGKYRLLDILGSGGMGSVYLCEHINLGRKVAIKILPETHAKEKAVLDRFYREARAVAALSHPNIVLAHDIDTDGSIHFLVMEYVTGKTLHELVKTRGQMHPFFAANCIAQAATGLQHAYLAGLVHRDIKPSNLILDSSGTVKILDLGLARFSNKDDHLTQEHDADSVFGTADFLAPEQAMDSHGVDIRADIYSLGVSFYFLLRGKPPFHNKTIQQKLVAHQILPIPPIADFRNDVPQNMLDVIDKMLSKDRTDRFQLPSDVVKALQPWSHLTPDTNFVTIGHLAQDSGVIEIQNDNAVLLASQELCNPDAPTVIAKSPNGNTQPSIDLNEEMLSGVNYQQHIDSTFSDLVAEDERGSSIIDARREKSENSSKIFSAAKQKLIQNPLLVGIAAVSLLLVISLAFYFARTSPKRDNFDGRKASGNDDANFKYVATAYDLPLSPKTLLEMHSAPVSAIWISPYSEQMVSADEKGHMVFWPRLSQSAGIELDKKITAPLAVRWHSNNKEFFTLHADASVCSWTVEQSMPFRQFGPKGQQINCGVFSNFGSSYYIQTANRNLQQWDYSTGKLIKEWKTISKKLSCLQISCDDSWLVLGIDDGSLMFLETDKGQSERVLRFSNGRISNIIPLLDGRHFAVADHAGKLGLLDLHQKALVWLQDTKQKILGLSTERDDRFLFLALEAKGLQVWDLIQRRMVVMPCNLNGNVISVANSADGRFLLLGLGNGKIAVLSKPKHLQSSGAEPQLTWNHHTKVQSSRFSQSGRELLFGLADGSVEVWDSSKKSLLQNFSADKAAVVFADSCNSDLEILTVDSDSMIKLWERSTNSLVHSFPKLPDEIKHIVGTSDREQYFLLDAKGVVRRLNIRARQIAPIRFAKGLTPKSMDCEANGKRLAILNGDRTLRLWDFNQKKETLNIPLPTEMKQVSFAGGQLICNDGQQVFSCSLGKTSKIVPFPVISQMDIADLQVTPNGTYGVTVSTKGVLHLWDLQHRKLLCELCNTELPTSICLSPSAESVCVNINNGISFTLLLPEFVANHAVGETSFSVLEKTPPSCLAISPDGASFVVGLKNGNVQLRDLKTGMDFLSFVGHERKINSIDFSADGHWLLTASSDNSVRLWNTHTGQQTKEFSESKAAVLAARFSYDGRSIATLDANGHLTLLNVKSGELLRDWQLPEITSTMYGNLHRLPYSSQLIVIAGHSIHSWDLRNGEKVPVITMKAPISSSMVSPDGRFLATSSQNLVTIFSCDDWQQVSQVRTNAKELTQLSFAPDGLSLLASANLGPNVSNSLILIDVGSKKVISNVPSGTTQIQTGLQFLPSGHYCLYSSLDRIIRMARLPQSFLAQRKLPPLKK